VKRELSGWLLDVYPRLDRGVSVWIIDGEGHSHHLHDDLIPHFFVSGKDAELRRVCKWLRGAGLQVGLRRAERYDLFERRSREVLHVDILCAIEYERIVRRVTTTFPSLQYFHADLQVAQFYHYERKVFPFAYCHLVIDDSGQIIEIGTEDSPSALDYPLPPWRVMHLAMEDEDAERPRNPRFGYRAPLQLTYDGCTYILQGETRPLLERLREHLRRYDPDVIISDYGDSFILPELLDLACEHHVDLPLNRDPTRKPLKRPARSRFSYGQIIYQAEARLLFGRLHIDRQNAMLFHEWGLTGAVEMARLARRPLQQTVRNTIGGIVNAMECATAHEWGCLIPLYKEEPEEFQSAFDLLNSDRGGLIFQPRKGLHFDVVELDGIGLYPAIIVRNNISGETMGCTCCDNYVPELGVRVCLKRQGLIPASIAPLVAKRFAYKRLKRQAPSAEQRELYRCRDAVLKMAGVATFGFAGNRHAKWGLVSAHAAICAYSRDLMLRAKDLAEARGFRVLHVIVDSLFLQKSGVSEVEIETLLADIQRVTGLPFALEARYKWIAFPASRVNPYASVPNRYFAAGYDGSLKVRGIELRRHDTPTFIKRVQRTLLEELAQVNTRADIAPLLPRLLEIVTGAMDRLQAGQVPDSELVFTYHLSRAPDEYKSETLNALVARQLQAHGVKLSPGESIRFVVSDYEAELGSDRAWAWELGGEGYDPERYTEVLIRACENVVEPFGVTAAMLRQLIAKELPAEHLRARLEIPRPRAYLGPLFEYARR
jgi:DNA polymerase II